MRFNMEDVFAISPFLILLFGALILLLIESFAEKLSKKIASYVTLVTLIIAFIAAYLAPVSASPLLTPWLRFDFLARQFSLFFILIGIGSAFLASPFLLYTNATRGEYYFLLLSSLFGLLLIGSAADFLTLFLGIETLSIPLYILCGYIKQWGFSREAAMKYFLMGSLAAAFLLYGIALVYGAVGSTRFDTLLDNYHALSTYTSKALFISGITLITAALSFEAAVFPFHTWAPDVYSGAPTPVAAFMAIGTKAGAFAAFIVVFFVALPQFHPIWNEGIALLAYPTLIYANFVALRQTQLRRFFAYSGISHAGFLLIPLAVGTPEALQALFFYLAVYVLATFGAFIVLVLIDEKEEGVILQDLRGLYWRHPMLASLFILCALTLAGIPPTIGFLAKLAIFKVAFQAGYYGLVIVGLLTTVLAIYYYLRLVSVMFSSTLVEKPMTWSRSMLAMGCVTLIVIVMLSIYPNGLI